MKGESEFLNKCKNKERQKKEAFGCYNNCGMYANKIQATIAVIKTAVIKKYKYFWQTEWAVLMIKSLLTGVCPKYNILPTNIELHCWNFVGSITPCFLDNKKKIFKLKY